jgi:hypothetical protein
MKSLSTLVLAFALTAPTLAHAQTPAPPPPPPAATPLPPPPPPAAAPAPPPSTQPLAPVEAPPPAESLPDTPPDERPSRGVGLLVAGGIFTGLGAVNLLTAPICKTDLVGNRDTQNTCFVASLVAGGTLLAIGLPLLIVGGVKRSHFKAWQANHPLSGLAFSPAGGGGSLTFVGRF